MMAHAVLFAVLWVFYFFGSELALLASFGKIWVGQGTYTFLHDATTANYDGISLGFSSFFFVKILVPVSFSAVLMVGAIRSRERIAELIHLRASWGFLRSSLPKTKKGFTIVELVIVIGVIGILAGILIPTFVNVTQKAEEAALKSNLANAYSAYVADAGSGEVDATHAADVVAGATENDGRVYYLDFIKQEQVVLVKEDKQYRYANDAWGAVTDTNKVTIAEGKNEVCHYVDTNSSNVYVDVTYLGFKVYNAVPRE